MDAAIEVVSTADSSCAHGKGTFGFPITGVLTQKDVETLERGHCRA
ncbi:MAG: hypothetical protein MZW92_61095 [Comamonadaceae bacterium]|nr:hypothetical protein [Comamonadaceae bacterium]